VTTAAKGKGKRKEKKILSLQTKQGSASCGIAALQVVHATFVLVT